MVWNKFEVIGPGSFNFHSHNIWGNKSYVADKLETLNITMDVSELFPSNSNYPCHSWFVYFNLLPHQEVVLSVYGSYTNTNKHVQQVQFACQDILSCISTYRKLSSNWQVIFTNCYGKLYCFVSLVIVTAISLIFFPPGNIPWDEIELFSSQLYRYM